jgi:hypothetical protein
VRAHVVETVDITLTYSPRNTAPPSGGQPPAHVIP